MALCWTLDKLGPMARSAKDAGVVLRAISGADPRDPTSIEKGFREPPLRPKIAIPKRATDRIMPEVRENFNAAVIVLREFCDVVTEVEVPNLPYGAAVGTIVRAEGAAAFQELIETGRVRELRAKADRTGGYVAYNTLAVDYLNALRQRVRMAEALSRSFGAFDAIATPTLATVAYPIDKTFQDAYPAKVRGRLSLIAAGNLVGWPAIGFPSGFGSHGLPTGIALLGKPFGEAALVSIAARFQSRTAHHAARPPVGAA